MGVTQRPTSDGVLAWNDGSYAQLYRSGIVDAADSTFVDEGHLPSTAFTEGMVERLQEYLGLLRRIPVDPPVTLMLSLLGMSECWIAIRGRAAGEPRFGLNDVLCPPYAINDLSAEPFDILLPSLDVIANAAGLVTWPRRR